MKAVMATVGRKSLQEGEETKPMTIRLSDSMRIQVEYHAHMKEMTKSAYIRYCIHAVMKRDLHHQKTSTDASWSSFFHSEEALKKSISESVKDAMLIKDQTEKAE